MPQVALVLNNGFALLQGGNIGDLVSLGHMVEHHPAVQEEIRFFFVEKLPSDVVDSVMLFNLGPKIEEGPVKIYFDNLTDKCDVRPGKGVCRKSSFSGLYRICSW